MLIVEIGNNHLGDLDHAKELIRIAKESGAKNIKTQAFLGIDITSGSQPKSFYDKCSFSYGQYIELFDYAKELKVDLFFSIFSPELENLNKYTKYRKYSATQSRNMPEDWIAQRDDINAIFSINSISRETLNNDREFYFPPIKKGHIMYASPYLEGPVFDMLLILRQQYWKTIGYSDHTKGLDNAKKAILEYNCHLIEKHFKLNVSSTYRDYEHSMNPSELESLVKFMEENDRSI